MSCGVCPGVSIRVTLGESANPSAGSIDPEVVDVDRLEVVHACAREERHVHRVVGMVMREHDVRDVAGSDPQRREWLEDRRDARDHPRVDHDERLAVAHESHRRTDAQLVALPHVSVAQDVELGHHHSSFGRTYPNARRSSRSAYVVRSIPRASVRGFEPSDREWRRFSPLVLRPNGSCVPDRSPSWREQPAEAVRFSSASPIAGSAWVHGRRPGDIAASKGASRSSRRTTPAPPAGSTRTRSTSTRSLGRSPFRRGSAGFAYPGGVGRARSCADTAW